MAETNVVKTLNTRIALKYDSYSAWTTAPGKDLVLLKGEIGICNIDADTQGSNVVPTVLFKVGDGTKTFEKLPWASAKAADVYGWAKKSEEEFKTWLDETAAFATDAEVEAIRSALDARLAAVEGSLGGEGDTGKAIKAIEGRLDAIEGDAETEGSIAKAVADAEARAAADATSKAGAAEAAAKAYTDTRETAIKAAYEAYADGAVAAQATTQAATDAAQDALIEANADAIAQEVSDRTTAITNVTTAYEAADTAINDKIGAVTEGKTVVEMISDAQDYAKEQVDALAEGAVADNTADIAQLSADLGAETTARESADTALGNRLTKVEAFFAEAQDENGNYTGLTDTLDTLVEIQNFLSGEGSDVEQMLDAIQGNADAIEALEGVVGDANGGLVKDMADAKAAISALESEDTEINGRIDALVGDNGTIATGDAATLASAKSYAEEKATAAETAAKSHAETKASEAQTAAVNAAKDYTDGQVNTLNSKDAELAADIENLEKIVKGYTAEGSIKTAVDNAQKAADDAQDAADAAQGTADDALAAAGVAQGEIDALELVVNDAATGLAATNTIADRADAKSIDNASRIKAIEDDYLRAADLFIFNCGTAVENIHVAEANN